MNLSVEGNLSVYHTQVPLSSVIRLEYYMVFMVFIWLEYCKLAFCLFTENTLRTQRILKDNC